MATRQFKPTSPGPALHDDLGLRGGHEVRAREEPARAGAPARRPQQQRAHHDAPPGRRPQAPLPRDRLQAPQGRRAGEGRCHRVRPQPLGAHRAAALRGRRQGATSSRRSGSRSARWSQSGPDADIKAGQLPAAARAIPTGTTVHAIELRPGQGAKMARSAGTSAQLVAKEAGKALLRLPSGELRRVPVECRATVGSARRTPTHQNESGGKAGRSRWLGKRPGVRGTAMNPVDHPHGGGEGKNKGGRTRSRRGASPRSAAARATRRRRRTRDIVRGRKRGKGRRAMSRSSKKGPYVDARLDGAHRGDERRRAPSG